MLDFRKERRITHSSIAASSMAARESQILTKSFVQFSSRFMVSNSSLMILLGSALSCHWMKVLGVYGRSGKPGDWIEGLKLLLRCCVQLKYTETETMTFGDDHIPFSVTNQLHTVLNGNLHIICDKHFGTIKNTSNAGSQNFMSKDNIFWSKSKHVKLFL